MILYNLTIKILLVLLEIGLLLSNLVLVRKLRRKQDKNKKCFLLTSEY